MTSGLYLFQNDLRITDNPALATLARRVDCLTCVYIVDSALFSKAALQMRRIGTHRLRFLLESLLELDAELEGISQHLHVFYGNPRQLLPQIIAATRSSLLGLSAHPGPYENYIIDQARQHFPDLELVEEFGSTLFEPELLPFELADMPDVFTEFRKLVEARRPRQFALMPSSQNGLPAEPDRDLLEKLAPLYPVRYEGEVLLRQRFSNESPPAVPQLEQPQPSGHQLASAEALKSRFAGGRSAGLQQLAHYTQPSSGLLATYKDTRNGLGGWDFSSKLSPWLASGSLSPVEVVKAIRDYETTVETNESTYWLYFELLWREYYQWLLHKYGRRLFIKSGIQRKRKPTTFYPQPFKAWCEGTTEWPIVNASMMQLRHTGWMSNRGRQLVASCLINELQIDWRYGAAWFEQWLIDYDVASNWGNWQYQAGVGTDPRGQRRFDLRKQTARFDPDGEFVTSWEP